MAEACAAVQTDHSRELDAKKRRDMKAKKSDGCQPGARRGRVSPNPKCRRNEIASMTSAIQDRNACLEKKSPRSKARRFGNTSLAAESE
jgi:hypothetical protein